jgi:serine/threonine protein kinase
VYKAEFPDGTAGAVKVEKQKGLISSSQVLASDEIAVLLRVHHRNLVNLIGFCIDKGRHMLVFEFLPNGSLYDRLHQSILRSPLAALMDSVEPGWSSNVLSWKQRVKIAADVACGLDYLHNDADPPIVHRDVKSQNILLTATDSAKLADFGLSKAAPVNATSFQSIETMVRGSIGYLDPQYFLTGVFSAKSDVYSFGVVLLELISGHPAIYNAAPLASWAAPYMSSPSVYHEVVDKKLNGEFDANELESLIELSKMCTQQDIKLRPNMRQVAAFLNSKNLATIAQGPSEWMEDFKAREAFHKMKPMFIDLESLPDEASSSDNFLTLSSPKPRD